MIDDGRVLEKVVEVMSRCCVGQSLPKPVREMEPPNNEPEAKRRQMVHWMDMDPSNGGNDDAQAGVTHSNGGGRKIVTDSHSNGGNDGLQDSVPHSKGRVQKSNLKPLKVAPTRKRKSVDEDDSFLGLVGTIRMAEISATKSDDAKVPVYMWNEILIHDLQFKPNGIADDWNKALDVIRTFGLRRWKSNVTRGFIRWLLKRRERWIGKAVLKKQRLLDKEGTVRD